MSDRKKANSCLFYIAYVNFWFQLNLDSFSMTDTFEPAFA